MMKRYLKVVPVRSLTKLSLCSALLMSCFFQQLGSQSALASSSNPLQDNLEQLVAKLEKAVIEKPNSAGTLHCT